MGLRFRWTVAIIAIGILTLGIVWEHFAHKVDNYKRYGMEVLPPEGISDGVALADKYGQQIRIDWLGKVHSDEDLRAHFAIEKEELSETPNAQFVDKWGGWTKGPQLPKSGFFRTIKIGGKWWLVDPDGRLFFSIGIDGVDDTETHNGTVIQGRTSYFTGLPSESDPLAKHYGVAVTAKGTSKEEAFNFYNANLERKFGPGWRASWAVEADQRISSWGFNTASVWSYGFVSDGKRRPYAMELWSHGVYNSIKTKSDWWGPMPDVYDHGFADAVQTDIAIAANAKRSDPWLIGYFVDNELSWGASESDQRYGIPIGIWAQDASSSPAKRAAIALLQAKYVTIDHLNFTWNTSFSSWSELNKPYIVSEPVSDAQTTDLSILLTDYAEHYFSIIAARLKAADPNHLYLGCRFARDAPPEVVQVAAKYCDVVSLNSYRWPGVEVGWPVLANIDKPCIISEFGAGATDSGLYSAGLVDVGSQQKRGEYYENYLRTALRTPNVVGCHWFQYIDQPLTGRPFDGSNGNYGLVDIADTPYPALVNAAKQINFEAYDLRSAK